MSNDTREALAAAAEAAREAARHHVGEVRERYLTLAGKLAALTEQPAAPREPLTDRQIDQINCRMWASCPLDLPQGRMFARAIERAHGIGAAPAAPAQEPPPPPQRDPCPQCRPGVVCRTPKCGRLRVSSLAVLAKHGQPQGGKEAAQRERMAEKFANRATTQATADFDLPARSDVVQPQGGSNG